MGVLPVRYGVDNKIKLRITQVNNCELRNVGCVKKTAIKAVSTLICSVRRDV